MSFVIAGASSGSGKTTLALAIMAALKKRGLSIQPFKSGPDYIDPGHHFDACGKKSYNLDTWMMGVDGVKNTFLKSMEHADIGIIEGVMGLFDGKAGAADEGSTAHLAKTLNLPVVLVIDASGMAGSVAAIVLGFESFDPQLNVAGVIFNKVGSERHFGMLKKAVELRCKSKVLGYLPKAIEPRIPERHLGLVTSRESGNQERITKLIELAEEHFDLDSIISIGENPKKSDIEANQSMPQKTTAPVIAVAYDDAFTFYYDENLELLEGYGAKVVYFSPLIDEALPKGTCGIYLGGGYPEIYARELSNNATLMAEIKKYVEKGIPLYAECGGLMYLGRGLIDLDGKNYKMANIYPWVSRMLSKRKALGYREVVGRKNSLFLPEGERIRGHEFHYSEITIEEDCVSTYLVTDSAGKQHAEEGYRYKNSLASYIHLHFARNPTIAQNFVNCCAEYSNG